MLYRAWMSMESIMGQAMWRSSGRTGITPILFSSMAHLLRWIKGKGGRAALAGVGVGERDGLRLP